MAASTANIQKCVGVAIFDFSENGLMPLKWAHDFVTLPEGYKLCIICIRQVVGISQPRVPPGCPALDNFEQMEKPILDEAQGDRNRLIEFQNLAWKFCQNKNGAKNIFGKIYEGERIQQTLQHAIDNLPGLETLIVGCAGANTAGSRTMPTAIELQLLYGCSIMIAVGGRTDPRIASDRERGRRGRGTSSRTSAVAPVPAPASRRSGPAGQY